MSYRVIEGDNHLVIGTCDRCGIEWHFHREYLSRESYNTDLCPDCRRKPADRIGPADDYCTPWTGDIDWDTMNPINPDGTPYLPGIRICGHQDCVRPKHIIGGASMNHKSRTRQKRQAVE